MTDIERRTWRADIAVRASPEEVLDALTDVDACSAWSPVGFRVDGAGPSRLRAGGTTNVSGYLAGCRVRFRVEVFHADSEKLVIRAVGPVEMNARYTVRASARGSSVEAAVTVARGRGPAAAIAAGATSALLTAGVLDRALAGIAREAENRHCRGGRARRGRLSPVRAAAR
jgi:carbon monoxide dehydrogenase subunit G